ALLSTFIIGFPGESEADFQHLLDWSEEAQRDRVGCFQYEDVVGAAANDLPGHVAEEVKEDGTLCRTCSDAPEIDGNLFMEDAGTVSPGDILTVEVTEASDYDLWDRVA
ncbi:MAG: 30S ribosomal protein S12 methylthiotransferase RimO, partial [Pseudomonadota bacterium]